MDKTWDGAVWVQAEEKVPVEAQAREEAAAINRALARLEIVSVQNAARRARM